MGARIVRGGEGIRIGGPLAGAPGSEVVLDAGESGTAARFLTALAAVTPGRFLVTGSARLRERPMGDLVRALQALGASIEFRGEKENLPISIAGGKISAPRVTVDASLSSQFLSALLLAGAALEGGLEVDVRRVDGESLRRGGAGVAGKPHDGGQGRPHGKSADRSNGHHVVSRRAGG